MEKLFLLGCMNIILIFFTIFNSIGKFFLLILVCRHYHYKPLLIYIKPKIALVVELINHIPHTLNIFI